MKTEIRITFNPAGFAECLAGMSGMVQSVCEQEAAKYNGPGEYTIEVTNEPRFLDASYGVSRPIARAIPVGRIIGDETASADEAENKSLSRVVG